MADRQTILIVDDDPFTLEMHCAFFNKDHHVLSASSGRVALDVASKEHPDLIILDVVMPKMNGYEVLAHLKENPTTQNIPVVFLTSNDQDADEAMGLGLGAIDYWKKPFSQSIAQIRARNLLDLKRSQDRLIEMANLDGLTGLKNRRSFDETLTLEWKRSSRSHSSMALILADVDYFKAFNDTYGHSAGDDCLRAIANIFSKNMERATDSVARFGGEEFVCILPDTNQKGAMMIAEKLCRAVEELAMPHEKSKANEVVTASFGVASLVPTMDVSPTELINNADTALYRAKELGRNQVVSAGPIAMPIHTSDDLIRPSSAARRNIQL